MNEAITLESNDLRIELWPLGARLNDFCFQDIGNLVNGSASRDEALTTKKYNGAVVGPVANRIADGRFEIDGKTYELPRNENGITTLHSGPAGLHAQDWEAIEVTQSSATFVITMEDGAGGFPGRRKFTARYSILNENTLEVAFQAESLCGTPTLFNMALHPYWCLDCGAREGLSLRVDADRYLPLNEKKLPTGDIADVAGTRFDLRKPQAPDTRIDHNFCLNAEHESSARPAISLEGKQVRLDVVTNAPGVQVYTGKPIGIAIEPQHWPDAPHRPHFPTIVFDRTKYSQFSRYRFSRIDK